jgi:hypothetical protein
LSSGLPHKSVAGNARRSKKLPTARQAELPSVTVSAIKSATLHVAPASFCGYIFRAAGGFNFSASDGCRFVENSRLRTACFKRVLIHQKYSRRTSYAFTARMLRKNTG